MSSESFEGHTDLLDEIILENPVKGIQYRLTISEFYDKHYIGIREWYQDFEGEFQPTRNGITMPYNLHTTSRLFGSLKDILSKAETLTDVINYLAQEEEDGNISTDERIQ